MCAPLMEYVYATPSIRLMMVTIGFMKCTSILKYLKCNYKSHVKSEWKDCMQHKSLFQIIECKVMKKLTVKTRYLGHWIARNWGHSLYTSDWAPMAQLFAPHRTELSGSEVFEYLGMKVPKFACRVPRYATTPPPPPAGPSHPPPTPHDSSRPTQCIVLALSHAPPALFLPLYPCTLHMLHQ